MYYNIVKPKGYYYIIRPVICSEEDKLDRNDKFP